MTDNVCSTCGGSGNERSGAEYMGQYEIVGCDECWGTGFDDVLAGVADLRAELARLRAVVEEAQAMLTTPRANEGDFSLEGLIFKTAKVLDRGLKGAE